MLNSKIYYGKFKILPINCQKFINKLIRYSITLKFKQCSTMSS